MVVSIALLGPIIYHFGTDQGGKVIWNPSPKQVTGKSSSKSLLSGKEDRQSSECLPFRTVDQWLSLDDQHSHIAQSLTDVQPGPWSAMDAAMIAKACDKPETQSAVKGEKLAKKTRQRVRPCVKPCLLKTTHSLPRLALVTAVRGGDVFIRRLLEQLTSVATGSVYRNSSHLRKEGFFAEGCSDKSVMFVSTHAHNTSSSLWRRLSCQSVDGVLLLVRNPYDTVRAEFHSCGINRGGRQSRSRKAKQNTCRGSKLKRGGSTPPPPPFQFCFDSRFVWFHIMSSLWWDQLAYSHRISWVRLSRGMCAVYELCVW